MHFSLVCALLPLTAHAANLVLSNDDGWAEINIRTFYNALTAAGESVVLSAPAEDESGTGRPSSFLSSSRASSGATLTSTMTRLLDCNAVSAYRTMRV